MEKKVITDAPVKKVSVELTDTQIRVLLAIIDCETAETEPDWFFDEDSQKVFTWNDKGKVETALQEHLNRILREENFPEIFD